MSKIFWGFIFVFFSFTFSFGNGTTMYVIDVLPDFIGYLLIILGISKYETNKNFKIAKVTSIFMFVISLLYFIGVTLSVTIINNIIINVIYLLKLFTVYYVIKGCEIVAKEFEGEEVVAKINTVLYFIIITGVVGVVLGFIIPFIGGMLIFASIVGSVILVIKFRKLKNLEKYYVPKIEVIDESISSQDL